MYVENLKTKNGDDEMEIIDVYNKKTLEYIESFEYTDENVIDYIADLHPMYERELIESSTGVLVFSTIGFLIFEATNEEWLEKIRPIIFDKRTEKVVINEVTVFDRRNMKNN